MNAGTLTTKTRQRRRLKRAPPGRRVAWLPALLLLGLLWLAMPTAAATAVLRILVTTGTSLPFADISQGDPRGNDLQLQGGIIRDWGQALAERLGREPRFLLMPTRRVGLQLRNGSFDLQCFENPQWYGREDAAWIDWLPHPLMEVIEGLVSTADAPPVKTLEELQGKTIGVVNGYRYPLLDPLFDTGQMQRSVAQNESRLLQMQQLGRADYSVISLLQFEHARARDPKLRSLVASPLEVSRTALYCLRQRQSPISRAELAAAQRALLLEGRLKAILDRYR